MLITKHAWTGNRELESIVHGTYETYVVEPSAQPGLIVAMESLTRIDPITVTFNALRVRNVSDSLFTQSVSMLIIMSKGWQGKGIARILTSHVEQRALDIPGARRIRLVTDTGNTGSISLRKGMTRQLQEVVITGQSCK